MIQEILYECNEFGKFEGINLYKVHVIMKAETLNIY